MTQVKHPFTQVSWPRRLAPIATSAVVGNTDRLGTVDILLMGDDDPLLAANSDTIEGDDAPIKRLRKAARVSVQPSTDVPQSSGADSNNDSSGILDKSLRENRSQSLWRTRSTNKASKRAASFHSEPTEQNAQTVQSRGFFRRLLSPRPTDKSGARRPFWRRWFYSIFFFFGMMIIWLPVASYVVLAPPVYNSSWTIIIPGTQVGASLDIANVGEAFTDVKTPYGGNSFSPGVNFKMIMSSVSVMGAAAERLDMSLDDFGSPKIQVTDQAATLEVIFSGDSAELAQAKSTALYEAFQEELDVLRKDEVNARRAGSLEQLEEYRAQAKAAQEELAAYRDTSTVVSVEQYRSMVDTAGKLEQSLLEARVKREAISSRLDSMADTLGVDAYRAADVMLLRQDKLVQVLSGEYARLQAMYIEEAAILGSKHPKVVHARAKANSSRQSMIDRVRSVVGEVDEVLLSSYLPDPVGDDGELYKDVVTFEAERESLIQEINASEQLLAEMRGRIAIAGTDLDELEELTRAHQLATTILVSATSNLDLGRSNIYATYPLTQVLVEPTLPDRPKRLLKLLAILGGIIGSGLIILSILVVKYRDRWRQLILKSA